MHSLRLAGVFSIGIGGLCALVACVLLVAPARGQAAGTEKPVIRVVGPLAVKATTEALVAEFSAAKTPVALDYKRIDIPGAAAGALMLNREVMFSLGKVTEKDVRYSRGRWKALAAQEHVIGAHAVAIVVHDRSPVETLTQAQLRTLFSSGARNWSVFGGRSAAIRRYGLAFSDPLTSLFHHTVLSAGKCGMIQRKKDSAGILSALASDPHGVAFADAVAASAAGDTVKIVRIGAGRTAIVPNAQTIKDGTYPLSEMLVLYISPKASPAAKDFARFVLDGGGNAICRKHGFMPTLRPASADLTAVFEKLYGLEIKRVKATPDTVDDLVLAGQMVQLARTTKMEAGLVTAMCEAAYELAANASGGETSAFEALGALAGKVPDKRFDCALKRVALYERVYRASKARADGVHLVATLVTAADLGTSAHRFAQAGGAWTKALAVAEEINSPRLTFIKGRQKAFDARAKSQGEAASLMARLRDDPKNVDARMRIFWTHLVELDNPVEATKFIGVVEDEEFKTYVPLASEPLDKLTEDSVLKLAEWYVGLVVKAGPGGKELMNCRARKYYTRFFELHKDRKDAVAIRATWGIQRAGGKVPEPPAAPNSTTSGRKPRPPAVTAGLKPGQEMTNVRLAEFVAAHPDLTRLGRQQIGTAQQITDLRPLARLTKLTRLELSQAGKIQDFSPLRGLSSLTSLTVTDLELNSISSLSGLSRLTSLNISNARRIADISPIGKLFGLRTLSLPGCVMVSDLKPLSRLTKLTAVNLSGCGAVEDIAPLAKLAGSLTSLNLSGTKASYLMPLSRMAKLKTLDLRECEQVSDDEVNWVTKRLPACKVRSDMPAE